jgi:hypothetical protein
VANLTEPDEYASASNQLWIYTSGYDASLDFSKPVEKKYLTCQLYNASYTTRFTWVNGEQHLQVVNITKHEPVAYPANASTSAESEVSMAYSAVMQAISSLVTGSIAFYKRSQRNRRYYAGNLRQSRVRGDHNQRREYGIDWGL